MGVSREFENQIDDAANSMPSVLASNFGTCFSRFDCIIQPLVTKKKKVTPYPAGERGRVWWHKIEAILRLGGWARGSCFKKHNCVSGTPGIIPNLLHRPPVTITSCGEHSLMRAFMVLSFQVFILL